MTQVGISDISKNPSIFDKLDDLAQVVNKKTNQVKGIFIPQKYIGMFDSVLQDIEYKKFVKRNKTLSDYSKADDTLLDGLDDEY